jgi:hypothetical protein
MRRFGNVVTGGSWPVLWAGDRRLLAGCKLRTTTLMPGTVAAWATYNGFSS